jgi:hypothetical protein
MFLALDQLLLIYLVGARSIDLAVATASITCHVDGTAVLAQVLQGV